MKKPNAVTAARRDATGLDTPVRGDLILGDVFTRLCSLSGTPYANATRQRFKNGDFLGILKHAPDPFFYSWNSRYAEFELDYQIHSFLKKYQGFTIQGINRETSAFDKWLKAEDSCRETNQFLRSRWMGGVQPLPHPVEEVYHLAQRKITEILGTVKPRDLEFLQRECRHGPGSDLDLGKRNASSYEKFRSRGSITESCSRLYDEIFGNEESDYRQDLAHEAQIVLASRLSFVPKTALIDRAICIEPRWNVFLQLGIGSLISKRLRRYGIDIKCQERNQESARRAYSDGLATIDLSSASDTIATNLVVDLLSCGDPFWQDLLFKSRCHYTQYKGKVIRLEKISSMGNGYTFPLETLIFYAFAWAATRYTKSDCREVRTYGDDLIVPRAACSLLTEALECFGFSVNTDKSYASGDFFESCGTDYFRGREVRPVFVKDTIVTLEDAFTLQNQLVEWASRNQPRGTYNRTRLSLADCVTKSIPRHLRRFGPTNISGVLHGPPDSWKTRPLKEKSWEGLEVYAYGRKNVFKRRYSFRGHLYSKLTGDLDCGNDVLLKEDRKPQSRDLWILVPTCESFDIESKLVGLGSCTDW